MVLGACTLRPIKAGDPDRVTTPATRMTAFVGSVAAFDEVLEDWQTYVERAEQFFAANGVKETHAPTLLALIGGKAYGLLKSLTAPEKPSSISYDQIVKTLAYHLAPKPPVIAERFRFHQRSQGPDETISAYVAGLRKLTQHGVRHIS